MLRGNCEPREGGVADDWYHQILTEPHHQSSYAEDREGNGYSPVHYPLRVREPPDEAPGRPHVYSDGTPPAVKAKQCQQRERNERASDGRELGSRATPRFSGTHRRLEGQLHRRLDED